MPASLILAAAGVGTAATATIVVSATTMAALTFAINFAVSALITRVFAPSKDNTQNFGTREQIPPSADNCLPVVYGDAWLAGTFVDAVLTTDQKTMYYVVAISHISANGQITYDTTKFYYGDRLITFDGTDQTKVVSLTDESGNVDTKVDGNPGKLYINLYTSNAAGVITPVNTAQYPHQVMGGSDIDVSLRWASSNRQMNGLAFAIIKLNYNSSDNFTNLQPLTFKLSHTLNGSGFAKPGDVLYDYLTNEYYGGAVPAANVDTTACGLLNAYADQTITYTPYGGGSSTQARYRINGVLNTGDTVLNNVNHILTACDSWLSYNAAAGQWSPVINKSETASFLFDDSNIVGEIKVSVTDLSSTYNQIEVSFPNKENKDQAEYVRAETPAGLLYPNEPVNKLSTTFNLVNDSVQAAYLANRVLEQAREDLIVSFASAYPGIQINAGDVVGVTNVEYGWSNKLFRVMKVAEASLPDGNLGARFDLSEYNAAVYDDQDITQFTPVPNSGLPAPQYFSALSAPTIAASRPNENPPTFDVQVTLPATGRMTWAVLYYATTATPADYEWKVIAQASTPAGTTATNGAIYGWTKLTLPAGSYYFSFVVGNELGQSAKSATSSVFNWSPLDVSGAITNLDNEVYVLGIDVDDKISKTGANILTGTIVPENTGGIKVGSITWNPSTGALTGGSGIAITEAGIIGAQSGTEKFTVDTAGNAYFAGDVNTSGDAYFAGNNPATANITIGGTSYAVDYSVFAYGQTNASSASIIRGGLYGYSGATTSALNIGVIGNAPNATKGVGVFGQGGEYGGYFRNSSSGGASIVAEPYSSTSTAIALSGKLQWTNTSTSTSYIWPEPDGSGKFLKDNGTWATVAGTGTVTSVSGTGTVSGITLSGTVTASGNLTLGGALSLTTADLTATAPGSPYFLSGAGWASASPLMTSASTNAGTATVSGNVLAIVGSSSTGIAGAYVGTSGAGSTVTLTVQTTSPSDRRLKHEIEDNDLGLAFVNQLQPKKYKLKSDPDQRTGYGFIADEVAQLGVEGTSLVYHEPNWEVGDEKGFDTIHYPSYVAVLTKAIQELSAKIDTLQTEIAALKNTP